MASSPAIGICIGHLHLHLQQQHQHQHQQQLSISMMGASRNMIRNRNPSLLVPQNTELSGLVNANSLHFNFNLNLNININALPHSNRLCFRSIHSTTLCFPTFIAPINSIHSSRFRNHPHFLNNSHSLSLRNIPPTSDILTAASPQLSSPFPEASFGPKARGACFYAVTATTAIFFFLIMLLSHPFILLLDRYRRTAHYLIAKIWAAFTIAPFFKVHFQGLEHLPLPDTPAVYVSNHQSFLDIYTLLTLGRSFKFISKTSIFLYPIIGWAMYLMGVIPLKRMDTRSQLDCLKRCIDLIRRGASVFFFPEGTRSKDGKLGAFKKGAFSVAAKTQVPVVPMTIIGTGGIMPAGQEGMLNSGSVKVVIHPCLIGNDAQVLCNEARSVIANTLEQQH